jgi:tetratricopeptide (TPR) repeat protein
MQISVRDLFARLAGGVATTLAAFSTSGVRTLIRCSFVVILLASVPAFTGLTYGIFGILSYWNTCMVHREHIESVTEMYEIYAELEQSKIDPLKYAFYLGSWKCNPGEGIRNWFSEKSASAYVKRGDANFSKNDNDRAISDYNIAIDIDPSNADAYVNRGIAYFTESNYDKAISDETKAIEIKPEKNALAYYYLGVAYSLKGDYAYGNDESLRYYDKAIEAQTKVIEIDPNNVAAYYNRGYDLRRRGNYDMAIVDETKVIDLAPKDARGYFHRGVAYGQKGDYDEAIADETKAIDIDPANELAYYNLSVAYSGRGDSGDDIKAKEAENMYSNLTSSGIFHNGLGEIGPDYKPLHPYFNDGLMGPLFVYLEKGIVLPLFWRATNIGVEKTAIFFQSSWVVRFFSSYFISSCLFLCLSWGGILLLSWSIRI